MSDNVPYHHTVSELHDALEHIMRMAQASKTQTNRLRRIALRAEKALNGETFDPKEAHEMPVKVRSPLSYETEIRVLRREIAELKGEEQEA